jgi:hypothetical protein
MSINSQSEDNYVALLKRGQLPVERVTPGQAYEKAFVYFPKRLHADLSEAAELGIEQQINSKMESLSDAGLVTISDGIAHLTHAGERAYAQIMVGFLPDHQRRLYDRSCDRLTQSLQWGLDGASSELAAAVRGLAARNAITLPQSKGTT